MGISYHWCSKPPLLPLSSLFAEIFQIPYLRHPGYLQACVLETEGLQEWLLVYENEHLIAFLSTHERPSYTLIANVGVALSYRRRGIASRMLGEVRCHRPDDILSETRFHGEKSAFAKKCYLTIVR
jgi:hypothetical protein